MSGNNDPCMSLAYEDEEAAEDTNATQNWTTAWTTTFSMVAGDYLIIASALVYNDIGYCGSYYQIQMDNLVDILPASIIGMINSGDVTPICIIKVVNIPAAADHIFDFDIKSGGVGDVAAISNKRIVCIRINI